MLSFSTENVKINRKNGLDLLRGIAVLLVICRHWNICGFLTNSGWLGVDLFFVLSGFLISGLLFTEHEKSGKIDFFRFFIRRGFKIYPLFFLLIALTFVVYFFYRQPVNYRPFVAELLFIQNYFGGLYVHTWSLAVEEHFYFILMICFALFFTTRKNIIPVCIFFVALPLIIRIWNCLHGNYQNHFFTHTRIDSLFTGVLLCYGWKYHKEKLLAFRNGAGYLLPGICIIFLAGFGLMQPQSYLTQGPGFTVIAFCCAGILLWVLGSENKTTSLTKPFAMTGFYSYAIYLVHIPALEILDLFGISETGGMLNAGYFCIYVFVCIAAGIFFSELVEQPLLKMRDEFFPSKA
ncbi:MAG TPA: acyltransferase [Bacteroidia bacterium]|jgi:peptidoglycan/LPS O-acetylase OafA/YrhL|nr:acyltransferase [Bacteroidia bacterium]